MKKYKRAEWDYFGYEKVTSFTEDEILDLYWDYWRQQMYLKYGYDSQLITPQNCIQDWVLLNYAWEDK